MSLNVISTGFAASAVTRWRNSGSYFAIGCHAYTAESPASALVHGGASMRRLVMGVFRRRAPQPLEKLIGCAVLAPIDRGRGTLDRLPATVVAGEPDKDADDLVVPVGDGGAH